jgi:hypothetical protein
MRKAFRAGDSAQGSQTGERSEIKEEGRTMELHENNKSRVVQTVLSLFGEYIISAAGALHLQHGAVDHKTYIERAMQMGGEITDCRLPQALNEEVRYDGEGRIGHWVALNESDENGGRRAHTRRLKCTRSRTGTWRVGSSQMNFSEIGHRDGLAGLLVITKQCPTA